MPKKEIDVRFLFERYCVEKQSPRRIALVLGVSEGTVRNRLRELGIPTRSSSEANTIRWQRLGKPGRLDPAVLVREYVEQGRSVEEIAEQFGLAPHTVRHHMDKAGIKRRSNAAFMRLRWAQQEWRARMTGGNHPGWKGGRKRHKGYVYVKCPGHPDANKEGYVFKHRLVMERKLGRRLKPEERVHHRNGRKMDNRPCNLDLFENNGAHIRHHAELRLSAFLIGWPWMIVLRALMKGYFQCR